MEPRTLLSADMAWAFDPDAAPTQYEMPLPQATPNAPYTITDSQGEQLVVDPIAADPFSAVQASLTVGESPVWQNTNLAETFTLHSNPDADHVIYLDFDGHVTSGTSWNTSYANGAPINTPAWSNDGDPDTFSAAEQAIIQRIWAGVAEDYAPFNVDVTTEQPPTEDLRKSGPSDTRWGVRVAVGPNTWFDPAGGVAYIGSFNWSTDTPVYVFNKGESSIREAASHEAGHALGLYHDGDNTAAYYTGHGSGATSWAPTMGVAYNASLSHWSKGEYPNASNTEDDLQIITTQNGFGYRIDDHGNGTTGATSLAALGSSGIDPVYGIIERNTDVDVFSFWAGAGTASIQIDPLAVAPNLDIYAELVDGNGTTIATSNPVDDIDALLSLNLSSAGKYFLKISGTGKGSPLVDGYTDYGSLGNYRITGTITPYGTGSTRSIVNAGFEGGMSGWEVTGNASATTASSGETPAELQRQARITNIDALGGNVTAADLETFLGLTGGAVNGVTTGTATAGSAIRQSVNVAAGTTLSFRYNFLTKESTPSSSYNDFAFFSVSGPGASAALLLADTYAENFSASSSEFTESMGYQQFTYVFPQAGQFTIGFGVSDVRDTAYDSALLLDQVQLLENGNGTPRAADDRVSTSEDQPVTFKLLSNDSDPDGDPLSILKVTQPSSGSVVLHSGGSVTYTPDPNFFGKDQFSYTVEDGQGGKSTANVTIDVILGTPLSNGGFEDGLTHWQTNGHAVAETAAFGESPENGQYQAVVTTINSMGGAVAVADLESFLGVGDGTVAGLIAARATSGSAVRQTISVQAGTQLTFRYNFLTKEKTPDTTYNDFSFFTVAGGSVQTAVLLADTQTDGFATSNSAYTEATGYRTFQYVFPQAGEYTIGFGVSDAKDTTFDSALLIDQVLLQAAASATLSGGEAESDDTPFAAPSNQTACADLVFAALAAGKGKAFKNAQSPEASAYGSPAAAAADKWDIEMLSELLSCASKGQVSNQLLQQLLSFG